MRVPAACARVCKDWANLSISIKGMTVTLMLRSVGALGFGLAADRYGRRWPMMINLALFVVLELGSGFCTTLQQFIGVRAIYGIAMGGKPVFSLHLPLVMWSNGLTMSVLRSVWPGRCNSTGRLAVQCTRASFRSIRGGVCSRLPPCGGLLPCPGPYNSPRMAKPVLVWRSTTCPDHRAPLVSPRNQPLQSHESGTRGPNQSRIGIGIRIRSPWRPSSREIE